MHLHLNQDLQQNTYSNTQCDMCAFIFSPSKQVVVHKKIVKTLS